VVWGKGGGCGGGGGEGKEKRGVRKWGGEGKGGGGLKSSYGGVIEGPIGGGVEGESLPAGRCGGEGDAWGPWGPFGFGGAGRGGGEEGSTSVLGGVAGGTWEGLTVGCGGDVQIAGGFNPRWVRGGARVER